MTTRKLLSFFPSLARVAPLAFCAAACAPSVPDNPTWAEDVAPILAANCVRCHTVPAIGGAPDAFRLDTFEDWVADDGQVIRGAGTMAPYIRDRVAPQFDTIPPMPPEEGIVELTDRQIDVLLQWAPGTGSYDRAAADAQARSGNRSPEMTILEQTEVDGTLVIDYEIRDPDRDIVVGELVVGASVDGGDVVTGELHSGRGTVVWDTSAFATGNYTIFGVLRDSSGVVEVNAGSHDVSNADVAPTVKVQNLGRDSLIASAETPTFDILVDIADPDSDGELSLTVRAFLGDTEVVVLPADNAAVAGVNTVPWDLTAVDQGDAWRLEVTVADQTSTRVVKVGPFIVGKGTTTETFDSITTAVLGGACNFCHPGRAVDNLTQDFSQFQGSAQTPGVTEVRGLIYRRVVQQRNMPPVSSGIVLEEATINQLKEWLLAGAPQ